MTRSGFLKSVLAVVLVAGCIVPVFAQRPGAAETVTVSGSGSGAFEAPQVAGGAVAWGRCTFNRTLRQIDCTARIHNIVDLTAAHIHVGGPGVAGPVVIGIPNLPVRISDDFGLTWTWREADFTTTRPAQGINKLDDLFEACSSGNCYLNFHTTANPAGEVRINLCPESRQANTFFEIDVCHPSPTPVNR